MLTDVITIILAGDGLNEVAEDGEGCIGVDWGSQGSVDQSVFVIIFEKVWEFEVRYVGSRRIM